MKARRLVAGASLGPAALKVACEAFDQAWEGIAPKLGGNQDTTEAARLQLANAILAVVHDDSRDPVQVKKAAMQMMAPGGRLGA